MSSAGKLHRLGIDVNLPVGAKYDILAMDFSNGYPEGSVSFTFMDTPRKITGIQKVAQTFLKILLTTKGSDVLRPSTGTAFSSYAMRANRTGVDRNAEADVMGAVADAETQVKYMLNTAGTDAANRLNRVQVLAIDSGSESITMFLYLVTDAGERAQVAVPFPQLDIALAE